MPASVSLSLLDFCQTDDAAILGHLTTGSVVEGFSTIRRSQSLAWKTTIAILKQCGKQLLESGFAANWQILLEYPVPRRAKYIDAVIVASGLIYVLEFKVGKVDFVPADVRQVEDYCLDLCDFHAESRNRTLIPFLIATQTKRTCTCVEDPSHFVKSTRCCSADDLAESLIVTSRKFESADNILIDASAWNQSPYTPTPTIVEAAQALFAGQSVDTIARCEAGVTNLTNTSQAIVRAIHDAQENRRKVICFVTGVPGSGKTLAGLNVVHNPSWQEESDGLSCFLSGNKPLVDVLCEALTRDHHARNPKVSRKEASRRVETFIQNVHRFVDEYVDNSPDKVPPERVLLFDEAQRAWNAEQSAKKFDRNFSEPSMLLGIMDRCPDWAVIVALIGNGQEINTGEAGLPEWGRTLREDFSHWTILVSPELAWRTSTSDSQWTLFDERPDQLAIQIEEHLHLEVSVRSYRSEMVSAWVNQVLSGDTRAAINSMQRMSSYPVLLTRSLDRAKRWLRSQARGTRRSGLVASSGARRLRAYGLDVKAELDIAHWLLNPPEDVRSSYYLEVPATEFAIQGLELDWVGVCWGGDFTRHSDNWLLRRFRGHRWEQVRQDDPRRYLVNKYRVLMTRAREGIVIWVPPGDPDDPTQSVELMDETADYLVQCGVKLLDA